MCMESGKTVLRSLCAGQQWRRRPRTDLWAAVETQTENRLVDTVRMERVGRIGRAALKHVLPYAEQAVGICRMTQGAPRGAL